MNAPRSVAVLCCVRLVVARKAADPSKKLHNAQASKKALKLSAQTAAKGSASRAKERELMAEAKKRSGSKRKNIKHVVTIS